MGPILGLQVRWAQWLGLFIGATGVILVVGSQSAVVGSGVAAFAFPVLAMVCLIIGTLMDRRAPSRLPVLTTMTVHVSVTAPALVLLAVVTETFEPPASAGFWAVVAFAALVPTVVGYGLYWWLLRRVGVTALNALLFLVAPTTAVAGTLMFAEPFTLVTAAGFAACAAGVSLVLVSEARSKRIAARAAASGSTINAAAESAAASAPYH